MLVVPDHASAKQNFKMFCFSYRTRELNFNIIHDKTFLKNVLSVVPDGLIMSKICVQ